MYKVDSNKVAQAFLRKQAEDALKVMTDFALKESHTKEEIAAVRRARQNARLIRDLDKVAQAVSEGM